MRMMMVNPRFHLLAVHKRTSGDTMCIVYDRQKDKYRVLSQEDYFNPCNGYVRSEGSEPKR